MANVQEFGKRLQTLQGKGLEIEVIGRKDRLLDLQRKLALGRFLKSLVLTHQGQPLVISLIEAPELKGGHVSFGLALQIPIGRKGPALSKADKSHLESFLSTAISESSRSEKIGPSRSRQIPRPHRRRASSGH